MAGRVRVGLIDLDSRGQHAVGTDDGVVVGNLRTGTVAEDALMNKWKMTHVEKVLYDARATSFHVIRPGHQNVVSGIVHQLECRDIRRAAAERDPDDAVPRFRLIRRNPRLCRRGLLRVRRHQDAASVRAVRPAVIRAFEPDAVDDASERQTRSAMHAEVAPGMKLLPRAPDDEVSAEGPTRQRSAVREVLDARYGMPVLDQDRVVEHPA